MSTCAFTVCVSVKTGVKITVNFYVKIDVNFAVKAVNFYTVNFYSVNFRAVIFYDFSAFWGWKCWRIFLAVLDNGGAAHSGLLGNLCIRGFRMLGKVCEHFILLHLTGSLSVLTGALRSLAHAVSLAHCVDCRDVLVELPVRDGVDAILADDKAELYERLHALPKGGNGLLSDRSKHLVGVGNAFVEKELPGAAAFHRKRL